MTPATTRRAARLGELAADLRSEGPSTVAAALSARFAATTAANYFAIMRRKSDWAATEEARGAARALRIRKGSSDLRQATPATPELVRKALVGASAAMQATILACWVSASRHADLSQMRPKLWPTCLQLRLGTSKSDPYGERFVSKWVPRELVWLEVWKTYDQLHRHLKPHGLTPHSLRRGAVTWLSTTFSPSDIVLLTGHAVEGEQRAVRRYIEANPMHTEAVKCLAMATALRQALA